MTVVLWLTNSGVCSPREWSQTDEGGMPGRCRTAVGPLLSLLRSPMGLRRHVRFDRRYTREGGRPRRAYSEKRLSRVEPHTARTCSRDVTLHPTRFQTC
jgi:hypothetical protein